MSRPTRPSRARLRSAWLVAAAIPCLLWASSLAAEPTVNGLFYGDGDDAHYVLWATSNLGSKLYVYLDVPNTTLYVALVVDRAVNDNVFGASDPDFSGNYMASAGWGSGGGQQRSAAELTNSEFATFNFACEEGTSRNWLWQQGYACLDAGTWVSDGSCGTSSAEPAGDIDPTTGFPPGWQSASSFAWNINAWNAAAVKPWNMHFFGAAQSQWKSPFCDPSISSCGHTSPPDNPNTVIGLEGYPAATDSNDLSLGPPITFNSVYQYEWPMVYEWSINVGPAPAGTDCGSNGLFLITGESHHSPMKTGVEGNTECPEEDDCFPEDGEDPLMDLGDLPDTYGTLVASNGARHQITVAGPYLGSELDIETDGQPSTDATGDNTTGDDDEEGIEAIVTSNWTPGSPQSIEIDVSNAPSDAVLAGWFDWNGDGDFDDADEFFTWTVSEGTNTRSLTVGTGFDWQDDALHARFRIFSSTNTAPGGTLEQADSVGFADDGEVEDYVFEKGSLPVTLNAFTSEGQAGGVVAARWQTASETNNVGFEVWGLVHGTWRPLTELIPSRSMTTGLPQSYEARFDAPAGLTAVQLVDYDLRGRAERFGSYSVGRSYGEFQPVREIDWSGPRAERERRLRERGFADTVRGSRARATRDGAERWKKLRDGEAVHGLTAGRVAASSVAVHAAGAKGGSPASPIEVATGPSTHVAVTEAGIQRVTYEALRDGGLDLAGVHAKEIAVTSRGEPVSRWISGGSKLGPGSAIEFLGRPPSGEDALYVGASLYQVSVDAALARDAAILGKGSAKTVSASYLAETWSDEPRLYRPQSPTGDPWVDRAPLVRSSRTTVLTLDLPVDGPVADGPGTLVLGLGAVSDLPDLFDAGGNPIPEHNVEVWFRGPGTGLVQVAADSRSGNGDWTIEAPIPAGWLGSGLHEVELHLSTAYHFSLILVDRYGLRYPSPYRGPSLDFAPDAFADGYRIEGFSTPSIGAYAEHADGSLTRLDPRVSSSGGGYAAELRQAAASRYWVTEAPHAPEVFTTAAPPDLLAGAGDLVVIAGSSFVGTAALDDYLGQTWAYDPVVVDVEDVYNAFGYGMALPAAITDFLAARDAVRPFTHVQLVGADCYDRRNYISSCISFVPLPTAPVGVNVYTPSQNRLVDLDGDGVGDKAVAQFSVRDEAELATIVAKRGAWFDSGLAAEESALLIAENDDGLHSFESQIQRIGNRIGWADTDVLELADHPEIQTARDAMRASLDEGRALTVFSGHSSPLVWSFRNLLTPGSAAALTNHGLPTLMVPLACETTYDISPNANVLGHQLLFAGDNGAIAISGAVALSSLDENEQMADRVFSGLKAGLTLGEAVLAGREAIGTARQELQDNWITQGDVTVRLER